VLAGGVAAAWVVAACVGAGVWDTGGATLQAVTTSEANNKRIIVNLKEFLANFYLLIITNYNAGALPKMIYSVKSL
jgi:hypothetical protein